MSRYTYMNYDKLFMVGADIANINNKTIYEI